MSKCLNLFRNAYFRFRSPTTRSSRRNASECERKVRFFFRACLCLSSCVHINCLSRERTRLTTARFTNNVVLNPTHGPPEESTTVFFLSKTWPTRGRCVHTRCFFIINVIIIHCSHGPRALHGQWRWENVTKRTRASGLRIESKGTCRNTFKRSDAENVDRRFRP